MDSETVTMDRDQLDLANPTDAAKSVELLPSQMANLEMINHLASYSELMVLVIGPTGSGKSYLATALDQAKSEKTSVINIAAAGLAGVPDLCQRIADHWGLGRMPEAAEQQRQLLINAAQYHDGQGNGLLVIIDNAELLDTDTLNEIAVVAKLVRQGLAIVLCGDSGFELQLRGSVSQVECHPIILAPLNNLEMRQLARQYWAKLATGLPLEGLLESLPDTSEWYPADVIRHIDQQVDKASTVKEPLHAETLNTAVASHASIDGLSRGPLTSSSSADDQAPASRVNSATLLFALVLLIGVVIAVILLDNNPAFNPVTPADSIKPEAEAKIAEAKIVEAESVAAESLEATKDESRPALTAIESSPEFNSPSLATAVKPLNDDADSVIATPAAPVMIDQIAAIQPIAKVQPIPAVELAEENIIKLPAGKDSPSATQAVIGSGSDQERLLAADSGYVVQLMGASQRTSAAKFIQDWQPKVAKSLYQYKTEYRQKDWFVVVLGIYPDRAAAQVAVAQLPSKLRAAQPWVRPIADVQKVLE